MSLDQMDGRSCGMPTPFDQRPNGCRVTGGKPPQLVIIESFRAPGTLGLTLFLALYTLGFQIESAMYNVSSGYQSTARERPFPCRGY